MTRTYLDSGVLIAAFKGEEGTGAKALAILDDPERVFLCSEAVRLELLPATLRAKSNSEREFYEAFFSERVVEWIPLNRQVVDVAIVEAARQMAQAVDSLHVAAAHVGGAVQLITTEKPSKPICKTSLVSTVSLLE